MLSDGPRLLLCMKCYPFKRKSASATGLWQTFTDLNKLLRGWINYYGIGSMKVYLRDTFGPWMRHKLRVVIVKQWKNCNTIERNLRRLRDKIKSNISNEDIHKVAVSRLGLYRRCSMNVVNYLLSSKVLAMPKENRYDKRKSRPGLVDPYLYYLGLK